MANIRDLKKDINYVLGDIIDAVYLWESTHVGKQSPQSDALIVEAIESFDTLIKKVNDKKVENKKAHFKQINQELEKIANQLVEKINALA